MATFDDVTRIAADLPNVTLGVRWGTGTWKVGDKVFAWERPLSKADIKRFGAEASPAGSILAVGTDGLDDKQAVLDEGHEGVFTISHFDGYAALLIQLDNVSMTVLHDLLVDAWMTSAPRKVVADYLATNPLA